MFPNFSGSDGNKVWLFELDLIFGLLTSHHTILTCNDPEKKVFKNIVGKGENNANQHFLFFPQGFLPILKQIPSFEKHELYTVTLLI